MMSETCRFDPIFDSDGMGRGSNGPARCSLVLVVSLRPLLLREVKC